MYKDFDNASNDIITPPSFLDRWDKLKTNCYISSNVKDISKDVSITRTTFIINGSGTVGLKSTQANLGWVTITDGYYSIYIPSGKTIKLLMPNPNYSDEYQTFANELISAKYFSPDVFAAVLKEFTNVPRYKSANYETIYAYEQEVRKRMVLLDFFIKEVVLAEAGGKVDSNYISKLNGLRDIHLRVLECQHYVDESIGLIDGCLQGMCIEERTLGGVTLTAIRYKIPNSLEKLYANELFEFVLHAKRYLTDQRYHESEYETLINSELLRPMRQLLTCLSHYDGAFDYHKAKHSMHSAKPKSIYDLVNACMKYYLMYRKKNTLYARYISNRYINRQQIETILKEQA